MTEQHPGAPTHPADAIAADGKTIALNDGTTATIRYSMGSLRQLEARFGSLQGMQHDMELAQHGRPCAEHKPPRGDVDPETGAMRRRPGEGSAAQDCPACEQPRGLFTILSDVIAYGLLHERRTDPDNGQLVRLGTRPDLVSELMAPARLGEYMSAWAQAFSEAMSMVTGGPGNAGAPVGGSPGTSGTTPQPSPSGAPTPLSG